MGDVFQSFPESEYFPGLGLKQCVDGTVISEVAADAAQTLSCTDFSVPFFPSADE